MFTSVIRFKSLKLYVGFGIFPIYLHSLLFRSCIAKVLMCSELQINLAYFMPVWFYFSVSYMLICFEMLNRDCRDAFFFWECFFTEKAIRIADHSWWFHWIVFNLFLRSIIFFFLRAVLINGHQQANSYSREPLSVNLMSGA